MSFESYLQEADALLSRREGMHDLRNARGAVYAGVQLLQSGDFPEALVREYIEAMLAKMRIAVETGEYPYRDTEAGRRLRAACDALGW